MEWIHLEGISFLSEETPLCAGKQTRTQLSPLHKLAEIYHLYEYCIKQLHTFMNMCIPHLLNIPEV